MAQERQRHTQKARLQGIVNKDGDYQEIPGLQSLQANYPPNQAAYRPDAVRYAGQPRNPVYNESFSQVDVDTRSHEITLDVVEQPPYTGRNTGAGFRQPPPSSHFIAQNSHGNPVSMQSHATYYTEHGPKGRPGATTIPPVGLHSESDIDQSSTHDHQYTESLTSTQLPSVSTPLKFKKLNEKDVKNVDSTHDVVVCGPDGVGKTTIINYFFGDPNPDIRVLDQQFKTQKVSVFLVDKESDKTMKLNFQEANKQGNINKYEQCAVAVVVYDVSSNNSSLKRANQWITKIKEHMKTRPVEFILVANKDDMSKSNEIMLKGMQLANEMRMNCLVTCAINGFYMDKLLENVAMLCKEQNTVEAKIANLEKTYEERHRMLQQQLEACVQRIDRHERIQQEKKCIIL